MQTTDKVIAAVILAIVALRITAVPALPSPTPVEKGLRVLWIVESRDNEPAWLTVETASKEVRDYLDDKCVKEGDQPGYRIWDMHTDISHAASIWQQMFKADHKSIPTLNIYNGKKISVGPPPQTVPELLATLRKFGGR